MLIPTQHFLCHKFVKEENAVDVAHRYFVFVDMDRIVVERGGVLNVLGNCS